MLSKKTGIFGIALFAATAWVSLSSSGTAFAATTTWVGTDCPATNCNWSNVNNWQGGVAPVNGDDIVINANAATPDAAATTQNDIANLTVRNIDVSGYATTANNSVAIRNATGNNTPLTITGNVTYSAPSVAAPSGWFAADTLVLNHGTIILGGDSVFSQVSVDSTNTINLNGHALTYNRSMADGGTSGSVVNFDSPITGNGTLNINVPTTAAFFMKGTNTYSGTTNINTVDYVTSMDKPNVATFGTSIVNLSAQSRVLFSGDGAQTVSNTINVTPPLVTGTFLTNQLEFWSETTAVTFTVPNINLLGNARFGINNLSGAVIVNLAGITANGHCVQYGDGNVYAADFQNGPTACVVAVASAPNTGFALLSSNPFFTGIMALAAGLSLVVLGKKAFAKK